jgi:hypothetical protein
MEPPDSKPSFSADRVKLKSQRVFRYGYSEPHPGGQSNVGLSILCHFRFHHDWKSHKLPALQKDQNYQISSQVAVSAGRHAMTFGYEVDRYRSYRFVNQTSNGALSFTATNPAGTKNQLADFLRGLSASSSVALDSLVVDLRRTAIGMFASDKWLITPKMTVEAGLRYELHMPTNEHNGNISLFSLTPPGSFQTVGPGRELYQPDLGDVAPRLGLVYAITGKDVIRTSGGIYYSSTPPARAHVLCREPPRMSGLQF